MGVKKIKYFKYKCTNCADKCEICWRECFNDEFYLSDSNLCSLECQIQWDINHHGDGSDR